MYYPIRYPIIENPFKRIHKSITVCPIPYIALRTEKCISQLRDAIITFPCECWRSEDFFNDNFDAFDIVRVKFCGTHLQCEKAFLARYRVNFYKLRPWGDQNIVIPEEQDKICCSGKQRAPKNCLQGIRFCAQVFH